MKILALVLSTICFSISAIFLIKMVDVLWGGSIPILETEHPFVQFLFTILFLMFFALVGSWLMHEYLEMKK